ncbi:dimethyl sulfoxide reductase anchor subunit family protein [Shimwellia blattae]|uniref:Anaerobic dimethyl sulfoxide reductase n=1 Tax=Shimwellia blattae (strain ATCC 29907 / DSM 4481 / JCM 1650 / NBRC 105725 / CDC 9005-74) TaxID=630626 RepID=I2BAQ1_SHIBC|nr:dimethyl sulfoxide reductase anchor subunit family protein [Shimwellia blattae]AFJ47605.1 anaerobic dimethyl sulfoxide reductase [Shimwellia blattae DSM 4481 = NBRC 105725]GAB79817.1 putative dimethyl sulfoxide reductase subunit YnfH [Shimwellia blattae DSM 4481 = NBRC 105725]VDY65104.1 DMSO reductase anchor subunit [Shimwellia blattae]VEC23584.1 DMSO reductase anchor subunit [Shimwellia blattae]
MGSGLHEWPLMLFTVLGQCVAGGFIVMGLGWLSDDDKAQRTRILRSMFFLWVLMALAFIASVIHLGTPLRAFNSLNRVGSSALSNEIASGSLFFAVAGFWWLVAILGKMPQALGKLWLAVAMVLGIIMVWMMARVYSSIDTVPTWYNGYTTTGFFMTMLLGGPLLGVLLLRAARVNFSSGKLAGISVLALLVTIAAIVMQSHELTSIHSSVVQATALVPDYALLQVVRLALLVLGLGCWLCPLLRSREPKLAGLLAGFVLVVAGELIGRGIFYGLHMTVGMAIAG